MDHTKAVTALIAKLYEIGYANTDFKCEYSKEEVKVSILNVPNSYTTVEILVGELYAYPDKSCYFVNFSNSANGNFSAGAGTPSVDRAIFDLGQAVWFANSSSHKREQRSIPLPSGIRTIYVEEAHENMIGDVLVIQTRSDIEIRVAALRLTDHEVSISAVCQYEEPVKGATINIDRKLPTEVGCL